MKKISYKETIENLRTAGHKDDSILSIIRAMSGDATLTIESATSDQSVESLAYKNNAEAIDAEILNVLTKYACPSLKFKVYTGSSNSSEYDQFSYRTLLSSLGYTISEADKDGSVIVNKGSKKWTVPKSHGNGLAWFLEADSIRSKFSNPQPASPKYVKYFETKSAK